LEQDEVIETMLLSYLIVDERAPTYIGFIELFSLLWVMSLIWEKQLVICFGKFS